MMAAEAGAARNTLLAYERDLRGASELLGGRLADAAPDETAAARRGLDAAEARAPSRARRRRCGASTASSTTRGCAATIPPPRCRGRRSERPLPKILDHRAVDALFAAIERRKAEGGTAALRLAALIELLYGSGLRATELVSLPRNAVSPDRPFLILKGKGGRERLVPISDRARAAVAEHAAHGAARRALSVPVGQEASEPGAALPAGPRARRRRRHPARADQPARAAPRLRHPSARRRRRPARACRCCSAMPTSRPPRSTPMSIRAG